MKLPRKYLNHLELEVTSVGNERRYELLSEILSNGTFLPKTVEYKDIDQTVKEWVESLTIVSEEGKEFPTMTLFSNQRFSEYSQSWNYVDENKNLLLNFKTILRDKNPQYGKIQNGYWNIPGDRFYLMKRKIVLDDNGTESILDLRMRQPVAVDFNYRVSIFTTKYELINNFNTLINRLFSARQCYIQPNGHYMPMILEDISDESKYDIEGRQFYSQTYKIRVLGYIITEDDYRYEEYPLKVGTNLGLTRSNHADVEIEDVECEDSENVEQNFYYQPVIINIKFKDACHIKDTEFTIDENVIVTECQWQNVCRAVDIKINGEMSHIKSLMDISEDNTLFFHNGDKIFIKAKPIGDDCVITFKGYNPLGILDEHLDYPEIEEERAQFVEEYDIE